MTPEASSARTRSAHGVGLKPTIFANATMDRRPSRCSSARILRSMASSFFIADTFKRRSSAVLGKRQQRRVAAGGCRVDGQGALADQPQPVSRTIGIDAKEGDE